MQPRTAERLLRQATAEIEMDAGLSDKEKASTKAAVEKAVKGFEVPNTSVYRMAVGAVALIAILLVLGSIWIATNGGKAEIPDFFAVAVGAAIGALAGMLVPTGGA